MKVIVTKVDVTVEGGSDEIREAMPSILGVDQPAAIVVKAADEPTMLEAPVVEDVEPATKPAPRPRRTTHTVADLEDALYDTAGVEALTEPIEDWREIPPDYRWWNDTMTTCHIRTRPGIDVAWCKKAPGKIGHRRMATDMPPAESIADVCQACNKRITEAQRP